METNIISEINKQLQKESCIIYRLPRDGKLTFCSIKRSIEVTHKDFDSYLNLKGFFLFPFDTKSEKAWWFETTENQFEPENKSFPKLIAVQNETVICENTFETYTHQFKKMAKALEEETVQKVILSRKIQVEQNLIPHLAKIYLNLCRTASNAFVYLLHTPQTGIWIGASPEILLDKTDDTVTTVSLAGTRRIYDSEMYKWGGKEQEEQQMVSNYIDELLTRSKINNYKKIGPSVVKAGNVTHLKTLYSFPYSNIENKTGEFIEQLHPTPALCGEPKEKAMQLIRETESHKREYYGGFLGPVNRDGLHLFVNIRCMKTNQNHSTIFAGGGLTRRSVLQEEWDETILKSHMMLSAIEQSLQQAQA
ncbi:chorismate-binding protein [Natronoflexus pectinivorans]|uniref:Isochorismate synthase n=1 Tax=Natronoflexus pectinivorans TaxID=682526 RepID=A0A4R2GLG6_9BACT|nr:chorismate-binding protein [Natronoflexus pectinivorans]TCO09832.1 isochorismate synthase [Natronoflexus pectinivorans]